MSIVTVAQIKTEMKAETTTAAQDAILLNLARYVTRRWKDIAGMDFEPYQRTRTITVNGDTALVYGTQLRLPEPLLAATSIVSDGTTLTMDTDVYAEPIDASPIGVLRLSDAGNYLSWYPCNSTTTFNTVSVSGLWGYRTEYSTDGWVDTLATLAANITDTTTKTLTVSDADGYDNIYRSPAFSPGALFKIDNEFFEADAVNTTTNVITARRGQRGTTAATHTSGTKIYTWNPEPDVVQALAKAAAYKFASIGVNHEVEVTDLATITFPADMPKLVYAIAQRFAYGY